MSPRIHELEAEVAMVPAGADSVGILLIGVVEVEDEAVLLLEELVGDVGGHIPLVVLELYSHAVGGHIGAKIASGHGYLGV